MYSNRDFNRWRRHPWHGLRARRDGAPDDIVQVYVEMTPADVVKYEVDKASGFLMVDRPQRTTSSPPALYGFIPRTYCGEEVAKRCPHADVADGDPLDGDMSDFIAKAKWHKVQFVLMPKDTTVTLRMPKAMLDKAKQVAQKKGLKYQKMLRDVIADFLSKAA